MCAAWAQVAPPAASSKPKADVIFTHGNIYTGVVDATASLGAGNRAEALAILGDRILAVGARDESHEDERAGHQRSSTWTAVSSCPDLTMLTCIWRAPGLKR